MPLMMDIEGLNRFLERDFPQVTDDFTILELSEMAIRMKMHVSERNLRPGGTISGPTMFTLADCAIYLVTLAMIGPKALAVTTNASIDFMRKPASGADLIGDCRLLKLGRTLAVGECLIYSEGQDLPAARASMTYSIPPER